MSTEYSRSKSNVAKGLRALEDLQDFILVCYLDNRETYAKMSGKDEDKYKHIDVYMVGGRFPKNKETSIDIKAMKKVDRRYDLSDEYIWVEFINNDGYIGWLYGKAKYIAFQFTEYYLLVNREELVKLCEKLTDIFNIIPNLKTNNRQFIMSDYNMLVADGLMYRSNEKHIDNVFKPYNRGIEHTHADVSALIPLECLNSIKDKIQIVIPPFSGMVEKLKKQRDIRTAEDREERKKYLKSIGKLKPEEDNAIST